LLFDSKYDWVYNSLPHQIQRRRKAGHVLDHVVERDEQADEREAGTGRRVVSQIDANPNSASATPT